MKKPTERKLEVTPDNAGAAQGLVRDLTGLPNATVRGLFDHGCVWVNGSPCAEPGTKLAAGTALMVRYDPERKYRDKPRARPNRAFRLVHEDIHLLVVEKFAGVLTEPGKGEPDTLVDYLATYLKQGSTQKRRPWVVHRLDRDTSGLLVLAKRREIAEAIKKQFHDRKPERVYYAVAAGELKQSRGTFRSYLATDRGLNQYSTGNSKIGKLAITHYEVVRRVEGATVLKVRLETGRRNQIRVHLAEAGHPLLGDPRYEPQRAHHPLWKARRVALHAAVLGFTHPITGEPMRFECPLPPEFAGFVPEG